MPIISQPLTSVILVTYYTGASLFHAIESILKQQAPVELVIVDNGNPEAIVTHMQAMASADPRITLLTGHGNVGFGRGNNLGVKASHGDYLIILNPDCELRNDTLAILHQQATKLVSPFMIGARILNEDGSDQRGCRRELLTPTTAFIEALHLSRFFPHLRLNRHQDALPSAITPIPAISGAFMFISRPDFDRIAGFDEEYFLHVEDLDFCFRFRKAGGEIYFSPDVVVTHIGGTSESPSDFVERHKTKGFIRYFRQNFAESTPFMLLCLLEIAIWMRYFLQRRLGRRFL